MCTTWVGGAFCEFESRGKNRYERMGENASEAASLTGQGFAPNRKQQQANQARVSAEQRMAILRAEAQLDPLSTSAATALRDMSLDNVDFDEGIRRIKTRVREVAQSDAFTETLQREALDEFANSMRTADGITGIPPSVASHLGDDWTAYPQSVSTGLLHMRGSFPKVTELVGAFGKANNRLLLVKTLKQKLMQYREELHEPVIHETAPQIPKAASNIKEYLCNVAGFCVHGANGRSIILMHTNVNRVLHARFSKKYGQSAVANKAMVVLCAICEYDTTVTGDDGEELIQHTVVNKWCHLGVYMQKPRGFGCQLLTMQEHQDVVTVDSECGVVQLDLEFSYETAWDFCRFFDKSRSWHFRFFELLTDSRVPIGALTTDTCTVQEMRPKVGMPRVVCFGAGPADCDKAEHIEKRRIAKLAKDRFNAGEQLLPIENRKTEKQKQTAT